MLADPRSKSSATSVSNIAGVDLRHLLINADDEELRLTQNAQPALCFAGLGLTLLLRRRGIEPAATAGHSVASMRRWRHRVRLKPRR